MIVSQVDLREFISYFSPRCFDFRGFAVAEDVGHRSYSRHV